MGTFSGMWAVVTTQPNCEALAARHLDRQHIANYHPRFRDHCRAPIKPLFPGYLFVNQVDVWRPVRGTRGVTSVISSSEGQPVLLGDHVIQELRDRERGDGLVEIEEQFQPGARVRVARTSLVGQLGMCDGTVGERVNVLLQFLGRAVRTSFHRADLELA